MTLVVVLPALALGLWLGRRGSLRGYFLWLGAVGYMAYTYLVYAVITDFNWFFLGYVAIFGLSTYTLVGGLLQTDAGRVKDALEPSIRARLIAVFFAAMGVLVAALWPGEVIPATLANVKPQSVASVGLPAGTRPPRPGSRDRAAGAYQIDPLMMTRPGRRRVPDRPADATQTALTMVPMTAHR